MLPVEIVPGLYRWSAPHPDWQPDARAGSGADWPQLVGCVACELPGALALIDPLLPVQGREELLGFLDGLADGRHVSILTTLRWHRRDRELLAQRYRRDDGRAWNEVPRGVVPRPLRGAGETLYWLPEQAALVPGDRLIGAPGGEIALCPESWLADVQVDRAGLALLLRALLELPIERVLVSHGEPVLRDGRAAIAHAISRAEEEAG